MCDEIQCGLGRTGRMFAYEHSGMTPDMLTLAKPLGGGLPLGAVLLREELAGALQVGDHGSTFGGNPVAAAASLVVLDRLTAPGFVEDVAKRGEYLTRGLRKLARKHPDGVAEVRGLGLMVGIELEAPGRARAGRAARARHPRGQGGRQRAPAAAAAGRQAQPDPHAAGRARRHPGGAAGVNGRRTAARPRTEE